MAFCGWISLGLNQASNRRNNEDDTDYSEGEVRGDLWNRFPLLMRPNTN